MVVERMEHTGQFVDEVGNAVRCPFAGGTLDFFREGGHLLDEFQFVFVGQRIPFDVGPVRAKVGAGFLGLTVNAVDTGMGVLDIVDRVFVAVRLESSFMTVLSRICSGASLLP